MDETKSIVIPMGSASNLKLEKTNLLSRLVEIWGEVPFRLIQHLDARKAIYGVIGLSDYTMWPLIRPGSIVQIDGNERKLLPIKWGKRTPEANLLRRIKRSVSLQLV